jgi:tetratricopeptide (TPR) repeat protein
MRSDKFWEWYGVYAAPRLDELKMMSMGRADTFRQMFEYLDDIGRPVCIVETGCIENGEKDWGGSGCSTILFDHYIAEHPGSVCYSFESDIAKVRAAMELCPRVSFGPVRHSPGEGAAYDSVVGIQEMIGHGPIDLLYLDASHHNWINESPSQVHHYNELLAAMHLLRSHSLVVVDDSPIAIDDYPQNKIIGKGALVAQYAFEVGAEMVFHGYQVGFTGMTGIPEEHRDLGYLINRARTHVEAGELVAADHIYRLILAATPPNTWQQPLVRLCRGEACANFARHAHKLKRYGIAIDWFRQALGADLIAAEYRCELARSLVAFESMDMARREAKLATELEPGNPVTWATLGGIESDRMDAAATIAAYDRQIEAASVKHIESNPMELSDAYLNRAVIALDTQDHVTAHQLCRHIHALGVRAGDAYHVEALIAYRMSRHEDAIGLFDKALEANCRKQPLCHWNKSLALQAIGRYRESWINHTWRQFEPTIPVFYVPYHRFDHPIWHGEKGPGVVHVHTEAGFGDNLCLVRYLPMIEATGMTVHYECQPEMLSLVQRSFPSVKCMPRAKDYPGVMYLQALDYHHPIGDLPHVFKTDIETVPWKGPYLHADPELIQKMRGELREHAPANIRRIGLCWSSGIRRNIAIWMETYGKMKSMPFDEMRPLLSIEAIFVSLQVGDGRDEPDYRTDPIIDALSPEPDWDETAALIANLDLVITVDTGVAHLAGAMGKPVWLVMQRDGASWHFMCERPGASWNTRSPWYPSMRIFRQSDGTWASAIRKVKEALHEM